MWYWLFKYALIGPVLRVLCRPTVVGVGNIPAHGPVIIAANHSSFIDSLLICLVVPRRVTFVAKNEYFDANGAVAKARRWFFLAVGQIPIDRRAGGHADDALSAAARVLAHGGIWAIHPEGTRTSGRLVHRGHTGVMRVARLSSVPIVPVGIRGTTRVTPPGARVWRPSRVDVVFGRPREAATYGGELRSATDELMKDVAVLAGLEYIDTYAGR